MIAIVRTYSASSDRNGVRIQAIIAVTFDQIPQRPPYWHF